MKENTEEQLHRTVVQLKYITVIPIVLLIVVAILVLLYLDRDGESFEKSARYRPPPESLDSPSGGSKTGSEESLPVHPVRGQTIYVPAYSHIYHRNGVPILLTVTLSIRNTSLDHHIFIESVRYFDTNGKEVKSFLKKPLRLNRLATTEFLVERDDKSGGSGANFVVTWVADKAVTNPILEAVMIDTQQQQGISFVRSGTVIREIEPKPNAAQKSE